MSIGAFLIDFIFQLGLFRGFPPPLRDLHCARHLSTGFATSSSVSIGLYWQ